MPLAPQAMLKRSDTDGVLLCPQKSTDGLCAQIWHVGNRSAHSLLTETEPRISRQQADAFGESPFSMRASTSRPERVR